MGYDDMHCIHLTQDRVQLTSLVNTEMNLGGRMKGMSWPAEQLLAS
jgi:hypothetical protein